MLDLFAHCYATIAANVLTPVIENMCTVARTGAGEYTVTVAAGMGAAEGDIKATVNGTAATARIINSEGTSQTVFTVYSFDAAGAAADLTDLWVTLERVPRVS